MKKEDTLILLVEDEDAMRLTLRDYLKKSGFQVVVASDGVGAIKVMLDHEVNVIISDSRMDILGGEYWIKFLTQFCVDKKILFTSGFLRSEFVIPYPVIYKPFDYGQLADRIETLLGGEAR